MDGLGVKVFFYSLRIIVIDGENFVMLLYINIIVVVSCKLVNLYCEEIGVVKMLVEKFLQVNKLYNQGDVEDIFFDFYFVNVYILQFRSIFLIGIQVKENQFVGFSVIFMNFIDFDIGFNGKLVYVIFGGNEDSCFMIDMEIGMLKILFFFDCEIMDKYILNIIVYDFGIFQKVVWCFLDVVVVDVNDNLFEFLQESYFVEVSEDKEVYSEIIQVEVIDKDLGFNGYVMYLIFIDIDKFLIDSVIGVVKIIYFLD